MLSQTKDKWNRNEKQSFKKEKKKKQIPYIKKTNLISVVIEILSKTNL